MKKLCTSRNLGFALGCAAITLIGIAADSPPRTIPVDGTFGTTFKLIPDPSGVFNNPIEGVGNVRTLGPCTIVIQQTVDFRNNPPTLDSEWVVTFADGDQMNVISEGTGTPLETNPA